MGTNLRAPGTTQYAALTRMDVDTVLAVLITSGVNTAPDEAARWTETYGRGAGKTSGLIPARPSRSGHA